MNVIQSLLLTKIQLFGTRLRGKGGVPWVQIMENELECLGDRRGHDGHLVKKFLKKYNS